MKNFIQNPNQKIVITFDKQTTLARIYENNKVIAKGVATCSPEDEFDLVLGSTLAMTRAVEAMKPKQEWVVVNRKPRAGDYVRIVRPCFSFDTKGDIFRVSYLIGECAFRIQATSHPAYGKNRSISNQREWTYLDDYVKVVEPAPKKHEFRKITRIPKRGDYVKIIHSDYPFDTGNKNKMLKINRVISNGVRAIGIDVLHHDHPRAVKMYGQCYRDFWHYNCSLNELEFYEKVEYNVETWNGMKFHKVDRELRAGDYIKLNQPFFSFDTKTDFLKVACVSKEGYKTVPHVRHTDNPGAVRKFKGDRFDENYMWNYWDFTGNVYERVDD